MTARTSKDRIVLRLTISSGIDGHMPNIPDRRKLRPTAPQSRAILTAFSVEKAPMAKQTRKNHQLVATTATDASTLSP